MCALCCCCKAGLYSQTHVDWKSGLQIWTFKALPRHSLASGLHHLQGVHTFSPTTLPILYNRTPGPGATASAQLPDGGRGTGAIHVQVVQIKGLGHNTSCSAPPYGSSRSTPKAQPPRVHRVHACGHTYPQENTRQRECTGISRARCPVFRFSGTYTRSLCTCVVPHLGPFRLKAAHFALQGNCHGHMKGAVQPVLSTRTAQS